MPRVLIVDNYDSFTWNLAHAVAVLPQRPEVRVVRNDVDITAEMETYDPTHVIISPGPGRPEQAGCSLALIADFAEQIPILGVCLGHQCLAQAFGGRVVQAQRCMHGKQSHVTHDGRTIFCKIRTTFPAMRYHSLIVDEENLPEGFEISARSESHEIMAIRHQTLALEGVQFHPESFATPDGPELLGHFLAIYS